MTLMVLQDMERLRRDFPLLERRVHGKRLVYLDSAATTQKPMQLIQAVNAFLLQQNAPVHRSVYQLSVEATEQYEGARKTVAAFVHADAREIVFTRNATEAINLVAHSWGRQNVQRGDTILLTEMEHHSNIVPWQLLAKEKGAVVKYIRITDDGLLDQKSLAALLAEKPRLLAITFVSNVLGTVNPLKEIIAAAHATDTCVLVDAAQAVPHFPVDFTALDADFLVFSGHKMYGPDGIGVLVAKHRHLEEMPPFLGGGEMIKEVSWDGATWNDAPWKFEAGTPNVAGAVGLAAAIRYLQETGMDAIHQHEQALLAYAFSEMQKLPFVRILGPTILGPTVGPYDNPALRSSVIAFTFADIHPHDLCTVLDEEGIAIRSGHHCAMPLHHRLGIDASARMSIGLYNTKEDIDSFIAALHKAAQVFRI